MTESATIDDAARDGHFVCVMACELHEPSQVETKSPQPKPEPQKQPVRSEPFRTRRGGAPTTPTGR